MGSNKKFAKPGIASMKLAPAAALTLAALAAVAGGSQAQAADAEQAAVAVDVLYVFAGEIGKGSLPSSPPVYYDGNLYGQTNRNGSAVARGGAYRLSVAADAAGERAYESVNLTLTGSSSGLLLTASDGKVYGGNAAATTNSSLYFFGPAVPLALSDVLLSGNTSVIAPGQWVMDTVAGSQYRDSIYFFSGGSQATNALHRYTSGTGVTQIGATRTDSAVQLNYPAALALDGQWLYGTQVDFNTSYVPTAYLYRIGLDGNGFEKIVTLGAGTDDAGKPLGWPFNTSMTNATVTAGNRVFSALLNGGDGWLYGTTYSQVAPAISGLQATSLGTVYRMALQPDDAGKFSTQVLYTFQGGTDGQAAAGTLVKADDGNLYGTTLTGGANGFGTLWRIVLSGDEPSYEKLYDFDKATSGATPLGLSQGEPYVLYGAAANGGKEGATTVNSGTLFRVELPKPDAAFTTPLAADVTDVAYGGSIKLSWAAEHAASCTASGSNAALWSGAKDTSGTDVEVGPLTQEGANTFILSCDSTYSDAVATSETVTVTVAANPDAGGGDDDGGNDGGGSDGGSDGGDDTTSPVSSGGGGGAAALGLLGLLAGAWVRRRRVGQQ